MANDFVLITVTTSNQVNSQQLKNLTGLAAQFYSQAVQIRQKMTHMNAPPDFSMLETQFGLPTGAGQPVFDLINGAVGAIEGTMQNFNIKTLTEKLG